MQRLVSTQEKLISSLILKNQDLSVTKDLLKNHLYSLEAINKNMNRAILSLAYSPGVGGVCKAIEKNVQLINKLTLRGRSVAVVTNGNFMEVDGSRMAPVMDWIIAQIKYYSNIDAFPFILRKQAQLHEVFDDLATSYSMVLFLQKDDIDESLLPKNIIFLSQQEIVNCSDCEPTDMYFASRILSHAASNNILGKIKKEDFNKSEDHFNFNFTTIMDYHKPLVTEQSIYQRAIQYHEYFRGKLQVEVNFHSLEKIKPFFTWNVLQKLVKQEKVDCKTSKICAIVSNGTAILGYGNIGPEAGLSVMEGKSILFKTLGEVQIIPICVRPKQNPQKQVQAIYNMLGYCKAINLEDFKAPQCFSIQQGLQKLKALPIFHDDQHGTAIIVLAAAINSFKVAKKSIKQSKVVINGAGAAGITIAKLLIEYGVGDLIICDTKGIIHKDRTVNMNESKTQLAKRSNKNNVVGDLQAAIDKADIFIGVSVKDAFKKQWIAKMNDKPIIFALANPDPEITPDQADEGGAFIYGSGRSDYRNQINNSLVFPGVFRAIVLHDIPIITIKMKLKAAEAIANSIHEQKLTREYIVPDSLDKDVALKISEQLGKMM